LPLLHIALLSLSYNPTSVYLFAWVGLAPLIILLYYYPDKKSVLVVWVTGFLFFSINVYWVGIVTILGYLFLSFYLSWYYLAFGVLFLAYRKMHPRWFLFILPFFWVVLEYFRSFLLTGFPWYFIGHSQAPWIRFIQIADIAGVYGISFIVVLANVFASMAVIYILKGKSGGETAPSSRRLLAAGLAVFILTAGALIYGTWRISETRTESGPTICLIQGNIPQSLKIQEDYSDEMFDRYLELTDSVTADVDLIVWPETMCPYLLNFYKKERRFFVEKSRKMKTSFLIGAVAVENIKIEEGEIKSADFFNSAYYFSEEQEGALAGRYDKVHLVPFGEYVPLKRIFPFLRKAVPEGFGSLSAGKDFPAFELKGSTFSTIICYENSVAPLVRQIARKGVDSLIVVTNDGWFGNSRELDEHFAINAFRAIENRLPVVYCANTGISGFVDSLGRKQRYLRDRRGRTREIAGTLTDCVQIDRRKTFYTRFGDLFVLPCLVIALAGIIPLRGKRKIFRKSSRTRR